MSIMAKKTKKVESIEDLKFQEKITQEDIQTNPELRRDILNYIETSYTDAELNVKQKLLAFEDWYNKYTKPEIFKTTYVKFYLIHQHLEMFIATFKDADLAVSFTGRTISDDDQAYKLEKAAEYDEEAMGKKRKDFFHLWNVGFYGSSVRAKVGYNKNKKIMEYLNISPLYWKPDPNGNPLDDNYKFHFFDMTSTLSELMSVNKVNKDTYFNLDLIQEDPDDREGHNEKKTKRLLQDQQLYRDRFRITQAYMEINGRKYLITLANQNSLIIRWEEIKAVTPEEKKDPSMIPFPISVTNLFPLEDDPFGMGYAELILDYQNAKNRLMNLAVIKEQENAGFEQVLVDIGKIANLELLTEKAENGRIYIPAEGDTWPLSNAIAPIRSDRVDPNTVNLIDKLDFEAQMETGMTALQRGVGTQPGTTFGEAKIQQINSNIKFSLNAELIAYGEEDFWKKLWYRTLLENMSDTDEKIFRIGTDLDWSTIKLKKIDMLSGIDPDIRVVSRRVKKQNDDKLLAHMAAEWPMMVQNPNIPQVSKNLFKRKLDELRGLSRERAYINTPMTPDEMRAMDYLQLINEGIKPKNLFTQNMDLYTYWVYLDRAEDNDVKTQVMTVLRQAMIDQGLSKPQQMWNEMANISNSVWAQMTSAVVAGWQESFGVPSREGIGTQ